MGSVPIWAQVLITMAAVIGALGVIWSKALRPLMRLAAAAEEMLPVLKDLTETFKDKPYTFKILSDIAAQFRTDSGSSLRDVVNRLEQSAVSTEEKLAKMEDQAKRNQEVLESGQEKITKEQNKKPPVRQRASRKESNER